MKRWLPGAIGVLIALIIGVTVGAVATGGTSTDKQTAAESVQLLAARVTNAIQLDDGTCGRNLQIGSDKTASSSASPTFLLYGDGGASVYTAKIDGQALTGQFTSDGYGNVCITTGSVAPIADGPHILTAHEERPNPQDVEPFSFSVDTVPPAAPSTPALSSYSDSPPVGDGVTKYRNINFHGTSDPNVGVQLYNGVTGIAGARADAQGNWSATTTSLADGTYNVNAAAFDQAGNKSALSATTTVRISQEGETNTPGAPSLTAATRAVVLNWSPPASDGNSPVTSYKVYAGPYGATNTLIATIGGDVRTYTVPNAEPWQYFAVSAVNALGEGPKSNTR